MTEGGKTKRKAILANVELVPDGDRLFRRSRTGCLTCRKRKKKCPEQYQGNSCLRCMEGGWKCVREGDIPDVHGESSKTGRSVSSSTPPAERISLSPANNTTPINTQIETALPALDGPVNSDNTLWTDQSLEAILGASLPEFDLSLYESYDSLNTINSFQFPLDANFNFSMTDNPSGLFDNPSAQLDMSSFNWNPSQSVVAPAIETDEELLGEFYQRYILRAWALTYPLPVRQAITHRYNEITAAHKVTALCQQAAAAVYLALLQKRLSARIIRANNGDNAMDAVPLKYLGLKIDAESIVRDAILLVRSPKDVNLTIEAHFWALSDLHMAVGAYCDSSRAYAIMDIAERLLTLNYGSNPTVDFVSKNGFVPFYLRAFAMIDLNRSICQRRPTFFDLEDSTLPDHTHINDGSHDIWFGLPAGLAIILASLSNLIVETCGCAPTMRSREDILRSAKTIETNLVTFRSPFVIGDTGCPRHPREWAAEISVETEIWRNTGLLLLWRFVNQQLALSSPLRECISLVLNLLKTLPILSNPRTSHDKNIVDFWSLNYTTPAFLIGTLLFDPEDRAFCKRFLEHLGAEKALEDMLRVLDATWAATDASGHLVDWFEVCNNLGLYLTFF